MNVMKHFSLAGPAEIIRAKQKDDNYCDKLHKLWLDILLKVSDTRLRLRLLPLPIGHFLYGAATTLSGLQTLGEEYTGIVQVDSTRTIVPTYLNRLLMLILDNFGSNVLIFVLNRLEKVIQNNKQLQAEAKDNILLTIKSLKNVLPFLERLHKAFFYCGGLYYQISKRMTGIHYVLIRRWLKDYQSLYGFKLLGIITVIQLLGAASHITWKWFFTENSPQAIILPVIPGRKCPLCLEVRQAVSATPCGHLFCWSCIQEWLQTQYQCPLCRETVEPSRVIPLQNYT